MEHATFGEGADVLFVMGWGNRIDGDNERWFVDRLVERGHRVRVLQLPTDVADFEGEYREPAGDHLEVLDDPVVVSHSAGGLVAAHLQPQRAVYLAPWWGIYGRKLRGTALELVARLPISLSLLPIDFEREEVGAHVTDEHWAALPKRVSPAFMGEMLDAQADRPPVSRDHQVFLSLRDTVISHRAVGEAVDPGQVHLYDGAHELFASVGRENLVEPVLDTVEAAGER